MCPRPLGTCHPRPVGTDPHTRCAEAHGRWVQAHPARWVQVLSALEYRSQSPIGYRLHTASFYRTHPARWVQPPSQVVEAPLCGYRSPRSEGTRQRFSVRGGVPARWLQAPARWVQAHTDWWKQTHAAVGRCPPARWAQASTARWIQARRTRWALASAVRTVQAATAR